MSKIVIRKYISGKKKINRLYGQGEDIDFKIHSYDKFFPPCDSNK